MLIDQLILSFKENKAVVTLFGGNHVDNNQHAFNLMKKHSFIHPPTHRPEMFPVHGHANSIAWSRNLTLVMWVTKGSKPHIISMHGVLPSTDEID